MANENPKPVGVLDSSSISIYLVSTLHSQLHLSQPVTVRTSHLFHCCYFQRQNYAYYYPNGLRVCDKCVIFLYYREPLALTPVVSSLYLNDRNRDMGDISFLRFHIT